MIRELDTVEESSHGNSLDESVRVMLNRLRMVSDPEERFT